ncbi:MAG: PD-(D/E)XK nuclease family protein [Bacilli bacterium]
MEKLSVSAFKSYLACPFRFYLDYVLRLRDLILAPTWSGQIGNAGPRCNGEVHVLGCR